MKPHENSTLFLFLKTFSKLPQKIRAIQPNYIDNPVALARINAGMTQKILAKHMSATPAYISKLEAQDKVTAKTLKKVNAVIAKHKKQYENQAVNDTE